MFKKYAHLLSFQERGEQRKSHRTGVRTVNVHEAAHSPVLQTFLLHVAFFFLLQKSA